jgi:hypothetical protein
LIPTQVVFFNQQILADVVPSCVRPAKLGTLPDAAAMDKKIEVLISDIKQWH